MNLTPERAWEIWWTECIPERSTRELVASYARAIEAEVLRNNGITDHIGDATKMVPKPLAEFNRYCSAGMCVRKDEQHEPDCRRNSEDATPRATGCPDTMDDMGRFAGMEMPAFLRKQPG